MKTISENISNEINIKGSKFICYLYKVSDTSEINSILNNLKKEYDDATHICYAYKLENCEKSSDDGEPTGTAGAPIMEILKKNDLVNILAVVVRYFGGTLLGAGGLIRAYSKSVREALSLSSLEEIIFYNYYDIISSYDDRKLLDKLTSSLDILSKNFKDEITYKIKIEQDNDDIADIFKNTNIKVKKN